MLALFLGIGFVAAFIILGTPALKKKGAAALAILTHLLFIYLAQSTWINPSSLSQEAVLSHTESFFNISFYFDGLSALFFNLIGVVGILISIFSVQYFKDPKDLRRCLGLLHLFAMSMYGIACAGNLLWLFVFWELTTIVSYLLISFKGEEGAAREAALRALLVTGMGGILFLAGIIMTGVAAETFQIQLLLQQPEKISQHFLFTPIVFAFLIAALTKSAQFPFHFWLPGAMKAPTPVSSYLHSATMVKAGIFLMARLFPALSLSPLFTQSLIILGLITATWGIFCSYRSSDMKQILAHTTVSALGMIIALIGIGSEKSIQAAMLFLIVHALYKSGLFMSLGYIEKLLGHRDLNGIFNLKKKAPWLSASVFVLLLSMMGIPPLLGFIAKELIYEAAFSSPILKEFVSAGFFLSNALSVGAALRIAHVIFRKDPESQESVPSKSSFAIPAFLALLSLLLVVFITVTNVTMVYPALASLVPGAPYSKLSLWHGFNWILFASFMTLVTGYIIFLIRNPLAGFLNHAFFDSFNFERAYHAGLNGLVDLAKFQTRMFFPSKLAPAAMVTFAFAGICLGLGILSTGPLSMSDMMSHIGRNTSLDLADSLILFLTLASVVLVFMAKTTTLAVLAAGMSGLSVIIFYVAYSAPDLALTQLMIETFVLISVVLFMGKLEVKGLRWPAWKRTLSWIFSGAVALVITLSLLSVQELPFSERVSLPMGEKSYLEAFAKNVVNVILVDFRAMDTFGEVTVMGIAALAALSLFRRHPSKNPPYKDPPNRGLSSPYIQGIVAIVAPIQIVLSFYVFLKGHSEAGGGFIGGLIAASGFVLYVLTDSISIPKAKLLFERLIASGLVVVIASAIWSPLMSAPLLTGVWGPEVFIPFVGAVKLGSVLLFDTGVYILVIGFSALFTLLAREELKA